MKQKTQQTQKRTPYISPKELAERWGCSRASVDRITRRAGISRAYLGEGKNGMVRYVREEVEAYEIKVNVKPVA